MTDLIAKVSEKLELAKSPESGDSIMETLSKMYENQGRQSRSRKADKIGKKAVANRQAEAEADTQSLPAYWGYTDLHRTLLNFERNLKVERRLFKCIHEHNDLINQEDLLGWSPLHYAVVTGEEFTVTTLLKATPKRADPNIKDLSGGHHFTTRLIRAS
jgi:hypothetical protein